jgi:hypothetical protein
VENGLQTLVNKMVDTRRLEFLTSTVSKRSMYRDYRDLYEPVTAAKNL